MNRSVTASAPAKTNLALHVGAAGADGYHPLETLFAAVDVRETVTARFSSDGTAGEVGVTVCPAPGSEYERMTGAGTARVEDIPTDDSNLAVRAAHAVRAANGAAPGMALHIAKAVPVAGGMGGGSADAAAALVAVDGLLAGRLGTRPLGRERLMELGAGLGADVPFLVLGGLAVGRGTGTRLEPVPATGTLHLVFVPQRRGLSTPAVYRAWDSRHNGGDGATAGPVAPGPVRPPPSAPRPLDPALVAAAAAGDAAGLAPLVANDLQPAAVGLLPELGPVLGLGAELGALAGWVSGSGPTVCFLTGSARHARELAGRLRREHPHAMAATAAAPGARVVRA